MIKHILAIVLLSLGIILTMTYAQSILQGLLNAHDWVGSTLTQVFSGGEAGDLTRQLLALLAIPFIIGLFLVAIYWLMKRQWFPYFMQIVWIVWLVQTSALIILSKAMG